MCNYSLFFFADESQQEGGKKSKKKKKKKSKGGAKKDKGKGKAEEGEEEEEDQELPAEEQAEATSEEIRGEAAGEEAAAANQEEEEGDGEGVAEQQVDEDGNDTDDEVASKVSSTTKSPHQQQGKGKGNKRKGKGKAKNQNQDIDELLKEINQKLPSGKSKAAAEAASSHPTHATQPPQKGPASESVLMGQLFSTENKFFDASAEIKKLFGSRIVEAEDGRRRPKGAKVLKRGILVQPEPAWLAYEKSGFQMELVDTEAGISTFKIVHPRQYQEAQYNFLDCVESLDPNNIMRLLQVYPYHIDSMLTLSEYMMHSGNGAEAAAMIERALFSIERSFHPLFNVNSGTCRLPFRRAENRSFFLALFRHILSLTRRGCWRTALEFSKLLFSLDPAEDPYCALQMMDYFALRANEYDYVLSVYKGLEGRLSRLPNWVFAVALAKFHLETKAHAPHTQSTLALQDAMLRYPQVIGPLLELCKTSLSVSHPSFHSAGQATTPAEFSLGFFVALFVERSSSLWKEPDTLDWWRPVAKEVHKLIVGNDPRVAEYQALREAFPVISSNMYRHVLICGMAGLENFVRVFAVFTSLSLCCRLHQACGPDPRECHQRLIPHA